MYNITMNKRALVIILGMVVLFGSWLFVYNSKQAVVEEQNICMDDELIADLIVKNINPFSKFKFIKKRNADCKVLLIKNKDEALNTKKTDFCPMLDASTVSVTMLIKAYVDDMYDRESASKELKNMIPLMLPYDYCSQYYSNVDTLIKIKKRLGLL